MGLIQNVIEAAGISTVSLSMIPELTSGMGAPRVAAIGHPFGRPMGNPGDAVRQQAVLRSALGVLASADRPGMIDVLPFAWSEPLSQARRGPSQPPPIVDLLKRKPWLLVNLLTGNIPQSTQVRHDAARDQNASGQG